jgi:hypothetical protein
MTKPRVAIACTTTLILTACTFTMGTPMLSASEVEDKATAALAEGQGIPLEQMPPLECPGDLAAEVGATMVCVLGDPLQGDTYDVTITVETVDGDDVGFDIAVADIPRP